MTSSPDETYVQTYQKYLKQKEGSEDLKKAISSHTASVKVIRAALKNKECKICKVLTKPGDLSKVLNQGLYHKYTSSQDYFYTRDINSLLMKKRKEFCIRYYDDLIFDECKERLKGYFKRKETASIMGEIKQFYTQFKSFPRNFHVQFFNIINSNIRKHRRLEYVRVFNGVNLDEDRPQSEDSNRSVSSRQENNGEINFMEMLGNSFLQDNYRDFSDIMIGGLRLDKRRDTEQSLKDLDSNFKAIYKIPKNAINDPNSAPFSNALYNNNYMLYSRNDSETAEDILKQIVNEFRDIDLSRKASISLAEKVLNKVSSAQKNVKKQENRPSTALKQRGIASTELSPTLQASKKSLGSSNMNIAVTLVRQQTLPSSTSQRVSSNPRNNSRLDTENTSKSNQSKVLEQRKSNSKFQVEQLNDISITRSTVMTNADQFRSTRSKSGGLKTAISTSKIPATTKARRPVGLQVDIASGFESSDLKQIQTAFYINEKSPSPSPERKNEANVLQPKDSKINALKRSTSQGRNINLKESSSPLNLQSSTAHSKSGSLAKRVSATPKKQKPVPMVQNLVTSNTSGSTNNVSSSGIQENPNSPNSGKFINPLRAALGNPQMFYFRHQSPLDDKMTQLSGVLHPVKSEAKIKNLNMRAIKNASPKRMDNNYRVNTLSVSGRNQNMLDLSQGVGSFVGNQTSFQASKGTSSTTNKQKKLVKAEMQILVPKISKRGTTTLNQTNSPAEEATTTTSMIKEKKNKKNLELSETNFTSSYKDLRLLSKEQTPSNLCPSSATSLSKFKVDVKKNGFSSYTLKGSTKDLRMSLKK